MTICIICEEENDSLAVEHDLQEKLPTENYKLWVLGVNGNNFNRTIIYAVGYAAVERGPL
jgi:hypothetical protein